MQANDRIRIETVTKTPTATNPSGTAVASSVTRWADTITITPAQAVQRYGVELDQVLRYEFRFYDTPTITLKNTRFVWVSNGHANYLKRYRMIGSPINIDGMRRITSVCVEFTGETADA